MNTIRQRALLLQNQDRYELAEKAWREVLALEPGDAEGHASLALCLIEREAFAEAEAEARTAVGQAPDAGFTHFVLARVLFARNRHREALTAVDEAVRHDPENADYRALQAAIHADLADWRASLEAADAGLALDAEHIGCANMRAQALTRLDRKDEAEATIAGPTSGRARAS
jgi:tetratricopeptide (TPR) repeat protein